MRAAVVTTMEVTPHLKTVLKSYQHSATKSLQGPGHADLQNVIVPDDEEDDDKDEDDFGRDSPQHDFLPAPSAPVIHHQIPILSVADTTCSEVTETILEGETIACFDIGGEMRLCLPQVLNSVLRDFDLLQINMECDSLNIYCSRCTPEQLNVLKNQGILPSAAYSCGLIRKTDAQRLCSALLRNAMVPLRAPPKGAFGFRVYHECFGRCSGLCYPDLYVDRDAKCIECLECHGAFSPQQFVCHVHRQLEIRTLHWGFDSGSWRNYTYICTDQIDHERYVKFLDDMRDQYLGKMPHPVPATDVVLVDHHTTTNGLKRKQMHSNVPELKLEEISLKKHILDDYVFSMPLMETHVYHCLHPRSAFKPIQKDLVKLKTNKYENLLQYQTRDDFKNDFKRQYKGDFKSSYQPNVSLAPPPKKYRYLKQLNNNNEEVNKINDLNENNVSSTKENGFSKEISVIKHEKDLDRSPDSQNLIDSTVSVVVQSNLNSNNRYNSEIELSTDTEDSGSELETKTLINYGPNCEELSEILKTVDDVIRNQVFEIFAKLNGKYEEKIKLIQSKDERIEELTRKVEVLENEIKNNDKEVVEEKVVENDDDLIIKEEDEKVDEENENRDEEKLIESKEEIKIENVEDVDNEKDVEDNQRELNQPSKEIEDIEKTAPE
ncbi:ski oncogene [Onthophagus taurus]|uniref:ski oncogene n=1 Tax=Onthophagus taurus TaxID=166361 RepID=UPI0039BE2FD7